MTTTHSLLDPTAEPPATARLPLRARFARRLVTARLGGLTWGRVTIRDEIDGAFYEFGSESGSGALAASIRVLEPSFWTAMLARGSVGVGEAWTEGSWTCDDLTRLVRIMVRNRAVLDGLDGGLVRLSTPFLRLFLSRRSNTRRGSRRNIAAHYDLGNDFFEHFLDPTMTYSCGIFEREEATMEEASVAKIDRLCRKLALEPGDRLLEIGTGWGAFAVHAAREYGCHVTTTTISREQYAGARERIEAAGLSERIDLRLSDYRDLEGTYDKLVHCEMVEAVGASFLPGFMRRCSELLAPHGVMAMQAITIADQHYARALREVDFIRRYIFPGSFIPSTTALLDAATAASDFRLVHYEDFGPHYARTLRAWRGRMYQNVDAIRATGRDAGFLRMWEYYLCYCEGGFAERFLGLGQMVFARAGARPQPILPSRDALDSRLAVVVS